MGGECLNAFEYFRIIEVCKRVIEIDEEKEFYQFILEDKNNKLVKYMALG